VFTFRNYALIVEGGATLSLDAATSALRLHPATAQAGRTTATLRLTVDDGSVPLDVVKGDDGDLIIPLAGSHAGCLRFPVTLPTGVSGQAAIDALDIGCRYYYVDDVGPAAGLVLSQRYPLFDTTATAISLHATMDPLAPLDPERTHWSFDGGPALPSFFRTNLGHVVTLAPQPGSRLVFALRPHAVTASGRAALTLVPDGAFALDVATAGAPRRLVLGTSGAEYVDLGAAPARLTFVAGQPAYAPSFSVVDVSRAASLDDSGLAAQAIQSADFTPAGFTTSWAAVAAEAGELPYHAQPDAAALYRAGSASLLSYLPVIAEKLPEADASGAPATYPVVAHAGLVAAEVPHAGLDDADFSAYAQLEQEVLSPTRRHAIYARRGAAAPAAEGAVKAVTPQGFLSTFSADLGHWSTLEIAQNGGSAFVLNGIVDPLKSALFSNQQFIVVSDPDAVARYFSATQSALPIESWIFRLDPSLWAQHQTVLLIKSCDRALSELVADVGAWALAALFNRNVATTQAQIQAIFRDADDKRHDAGTPITEYEHFVDTVMTDPKWNGVLFLNCPVPLTGLPDALSGLAAGIDASRFYAHHFGVNQTPIAHTDLSMSDSSLFGLIRYDGGPGDGVPPGESFGFQVESLDVLFENSTIRRFASQVILTIDALFGAPCSQEVPGADLPRNAILLTGTLQRQGGLDTYVFAEASPTTFDLDDAVLATARIDQATFSAGTTRPASGAAPAGPKHYRFAFRGGLAFRAPPPDTADLFSFDELAYVNLGVVMTFDLASGSPPHFDFDPSSVTFDVAHSTTRASALVGHFPLKLKELIYSTGKKPADLGYRPVHPPVQTAALGDRWYGLSFELNLGTLGALGPAGAFTTGFALVWSPAKATAQPPVLVGLKLPGPSGSFDGLPLMGLLKLKTFANQLTYSHGGFVLRINGVSLSFFGVTLPPGGKFDFLIFGDPSGAGSMGWYGAYGREDP